MRLAAPGPVKGSSGLLGGTQATKNRELRVVSALGFYL